MTSKRALAPRGATPLERALRRLRDDSPLLRRLAAWPPVGRLLSVLLLARLVRESIRFVVLEFVRREAPGRYTLRQSGVHVWLRHGTPDIQNFDEVFYQGLYTLPEEVVATAVPRDPTVLDLGANIGLAGAFFLGSFGTARVVAFEPDSANVQMHQRTIASNDLGERWALLDACAWTHDTELRFRAGEFAESHVSDGEDGVLVRALDVFPYLSQADVVKMDVEGSEWQILADERFAGAGVPALVLEYHERGCPEPDSHGYVKRVLADAGYELRPIFHDADGVGMLWAWRARR